MTNRIDLAGRVAVVTGGAQGVGRAIVERFLASGATVAIWDRDKRLADSTASELVGSGTVRSFAVEGTDLAAVEKARDATLAAFRRIDILVNNAGISGPNVPTWEYPKAAWDEVIAINLNGPLHTCRAIAPGLMPPDYGGRR